MDKESGNEFSMISSGLSEFDDELWANFPDDVILSSQEEGGSQQSALLAANWPLADLYLDGADLSIQDQAMEHSATEEPLTELCMKNDQWDPLEYVAYSPLQLDASAQLTPTSTSTSCSPLTYRSPTGPSYRVINTLGYQILTDSFDDSVNPLTHSFLIDSSQGLLDHELQGPVFHIPDTTADDAEVQLDSAGMSELLTLMSPILATKDLPRPEHCAVQLTTPVMVASVSSSDVVGEQEEGVENATWDDGYFDSGDVEFTDDYLYSVSTKDLNRCLQQRGASEAERKKIKSRRRTLKNRSYARSCREKRVGRHEEQDEEVGVLRRELALKSHENGRLQREVTQLRAQIDALCAQREG